MYVNEPVTTLADFLTKLTTFLGTTVGTWTTHLNTGTGQFAARKSGSGYDIGFAAQWDTATPSNLGLYQFLGAYNSGNAPYAQADDSGNGAASTSNATLGGARRVELGNAPLQYWAFEDDHYCHVVVEASSGSYRHFGFGQGFKYGDWTGGEYVYGQNHVTTTSGDSSIQVNSTFLLDGFAADGGTPAVNNAEEYCATVHAEGLPSQAASGKYMVHLGNQNSANLGNDRQGTPRARGHFTGGFRAGPFARTLGRFDGSDLSGHLPMYPIVSHYWLRSTNDAYGPMMYMKDVRGVSIRNYVGGDEVLVGGDTWVLFPSKIKWPGSGLQTNFTGYQGIAYKKVLA